MSRNTSAFPIVQNPPYSHGVCADRLNRDDLRVGLDIGDGGDLWRRREELAHLAETLLPDVNLSV